MKQTTFQHPELRDANDNIIQQGAFGKNTALANSTNDGWIDYVANDLEALYDNINGSRIYVKNKDALTTPGDISAMYIAEDTGKWYLWDGTKYIETDNARKIADEAIAARDAAKASANDAANSAREQQADWNVTDTTSKAFVKNKPTTWDTNNLKNPLCLNGIWNPVLQPLIMNARANRLAFLPADQIIIEKTIDGGKTWTDAMVDDETKMWLFSGTSTRWISIPRIDGKMSELCGLRVTIATIKYNVPSNTAETEKYNYWNKEHMVGVERYCSLQDFYFWVSAINNDVSVKIEGASADTPNVWNTLCDKLPFNANGWPGSYYCRSVDFRTGTAQYGNIRFTFFTKARNGKTVNNDVNSTQGIQTIMGYGPNVWVYSNDMMANDHLYTWDNHKNAQFPAQLTATDVRATGKLYEKGTSITDAIAQKVTTNTLTATDATFTGQTSVPTANAGNSSKAIANTEFVAKSLASLVNGAPAQLNTLNELAKALGNDANFSATITAELAKKLNSTEAESTYLPLSGGTLTGVVNGVTPPNGDNSKKLATTAFVNAKAGNYLPLSGGTINGDLSFTGGSRKINFSNGKSQVVSLGNGVYVYGDTADKQSSFVAFTNENGSGFQINAGDGTTQRRMIGKPDGTLTWDGQPLLPVGVVQAFAGTTIPNGWLLCDGSAVSRTDYAALYAVIGTTYGAGNGSTTFNLPNLVDKFVEGSATSGTVKSAGLPNITGTAGEITNWGYPDDSGTNGAVYFGGNSNEYMKVDWDASVQTRRPYDWDFDASRSNPIYGNSNTVQPPALTMKYIIKY